MEQNIQWGNGMWCFGTISTETDYIMGEKTKNTLAKACDQLMIVQEEGTSGKKHVHFLGFTERRLNNFKNTITKLVKNEGHEISEYTIDLQATPYPFEKLAYILKEQNKVIILNNDISEDMIKKAIEKFPPEKFLKSKNQKQDKFWSEQKIVMYLTEHKCTDRYEIKEALTLLKNEGKFSYSTYKKMNMKKLVEYLNNDFNLEDR